MTGRRPKPKQKAARRGPGKAQPDPGDLDAGRIEREFGAFAVVQIWRRMPGAVSKRQSRE
jgi:hypothetical protein